MTMLKSAMGARTELRNRIAELAATETKLRRELAEATEEITRIRTAVAEEAGAALLDGVIIPPEKSERRRKEITKLRKVEEVTAAALDQIPARRQKLEDELASSGPDFTDAALDEVSGRRVAALEKVRAALAGIAEPLAELAASDTLERDLLGQDYAFDPVRHPDVFAGRIVASRFLDALPVRLTPDELDAFAIRARAAEIAARWLAEVKED